MKGNGLETNFCRIYTLTLTLAIWPGVKVMIRLCEILSRSNIAVRSYGPDTVLGMCALWPWPWRYVLGSRSWHTLGSWITIVWNIIQIQLGIDFGYVCTVTLTLEIWPWIKVMTHHWVRNNKCVKYYPDPTWQSGVMVRTRIFGMCTLWPWPWRYNLGSDRGFDY